MYVTGEVVLQPETTLGDMKRIVQAKFKLPAGFKLRRRRNLIKKTHEHFLAVEHFRSDADYALVESVSPV